MTVSVVVPDIVGPQRVYWQGATGGRNNTVCHDGVSETLSAPGVVTVNALNSTVGRKQTSDSLKSSVCPCYLYKSLAFLCLIPTGRALQIDFCPLNNQHRDPPFCLGSDRGFHEKQKCFQHENHHDFLSSRWRRFSLPTVYCSSQDKHGNLLD